MKKVISVCLIATAMISHSFLGMPNRYVGATQQVPNPCTGNVGGYSCSDAEGNSCLDSRQYIANTRVRGVLEEKDAENHVIIYNCSNVSGKRDCLGAWTKPSTGTCDAVIVD